MLNQLAGLPIEIEAIDIVPSNCGFTESDIIAAQNRKPSDTGGLVKCLKLKLEAKVMLTVNLDVQDRLINGQSGIAKHPEIIENNVTVIYIKFDDLDAGKKLITKNSTARIHNWVPIKRHETSIIIRNTNKSITIKRTQFPLKLSWARTVHKVQGLSLQEAVISFDSDRQKIFKPGQTYVTLSRVTNIQGLFLTGSFKQDAIKANESATQEYGRLHNEALFIPPLMRSPLPTTLQVALLNTRSLNKHAADIASDWRLMNNDILFLTETQLSPSGNVNQIQTILDQFSISFNMSDYRFSSLAICYQKSVLLQCHHRVGYISN